MLLIVKIIIFLVMLAVSSVGIGVAAVMTIEIIKRHASNQQDENDKYTHTYTLGAVLFDVGLTVIFDILIAVYSVVLFIGTGRYLFGW